MDLFDIGVNTLNPYGGLGGILGSAGVNSLVDFTIFADGQKLNHLGNGKNIGQVSLDFGFGTFSSGVGAILDPIRLLQFLWILLLEMSQVRHKKLSRTKIFDIYG